MRPGMSLFVLAGQTQQQPRRRTSTKPSAFGPPHPTAALLALSPAAPPPQQESTLKKFLVSGGVAWVYEFGLGHFLEFIKIQKQTNPSKSYFELARGIVGEKGIVGVWDGFFPWGTVQAIAKGAVFGGAHTLALGYVRPFVDSGDVSNVVAETIAGGIGGGFQGLVLSPTLLLKTRVMTDPVFRTNMTMWETSKQSARVGLKVIQNEGLAALMKGSLTFSLKRVADWGTRFYFSVLVEDLVFRKGDAAVVLTGQEKLAASLIGGTLSSGTYVLGWKRKEDVLGWKRKEAVDPFIHFDSPPRMPSHTHTHTLSLALTLPLDVIVATIQQASKAGQKVSVLQTFSEEYKAGGWERVAGFATRGFVARTVHVAFTTALMKLSLLLQRTQRRKSPPHPPPPPSPHRPTHTRPTAPHSKARETDYPPTHPPPLKQTLTSLVYDIFYPKPVGLPVLPKE